MSGWLAPLAEAQRDAEQREIRAEIDKENNERLRRERENAAALMRYHKNKKKASPGT